MPLFLDVQQRLMFALIAYSVLLGIDKYLAAS